ncbi:MAG: segregation/condensation protein A [Eubacteriaceae bacterium]|nr:segregation/condensation protein A [Eubacteriaceae bacterium]
MKQNFSLDAFEGPLDLLLYLVQQNEIDIFDIPIAQITSQFLDYLSLCDVFDIESASEFIAMASLLIELKSRELLPKGDDASDSSEAFTSEELSKMLLEYKAIKHIAAYLKHYEEEHLLHIGKDPLFFCDMEPEALELGIQPADLYAALQKALAKSLTAQQRAKPAAYQIPEPYASVEEMSDKVKQLLSIQKKAAFFDLLKGISRDEAIAFFLAILELFKRGFIDIVQEYEFGDISLMLIT